MPTRGLPTAGIRSRTSAAGIVSSRSVLLVVSLLLVPGPGGFSARAEESPAPTAISAAAALETTLVDAIAAAEKSVVAIARVRHAERDEPGTALEMRQDPFGRLRPMGSQPPGPGDPEFVPNDFATGVIVDAKGLIVTHFHVLGDENDQYFVTAENRRVYRASVKAADPRSDLAVLSIDAKDLTPIKFGDASTLKKGQIVISLGNPYGIARDGQVSASWGIVSNVSRKGAASPPEDLRLGTQKQATLHQFGTLIQTDAKLNLGTSGGALINLKGEMVGLTTSAAALAGYEQAAGYAVPVDETFLRVLEKLKQGREVEYGFLGVAPVRLEKEEIQAGKHGTKVGEVFPGTPAFTADLHPDDIISHVNGQPIYDSEGLFLQVGKLAAESDVKLTVERPVERTVDRNGESHKVWRPVAIEPIHLAKFGVLGKKIVTDPSPSWRGIRVDHPSVKVVTRTPPPRDGGKFVSCVLVTEVEQYSPAWKEDLRPDMYITHVGKTSVTTPKEFQAAVAGKTGPVTLRVINGSGDGRSTIKVIPPGDE